MITFQETAFLLFSLPILCNQSVCVFCHFGFRFPVREIDSDCISSRHFVIFQVLVSKLSFFLDGRRVLLLQLTNYRNNLQTNVYLF